MEVFPSPVIKREQYIEIYNPHDTQIELMGYQICTRNGRRKTPKCYRLQEFSLDPGAYFMLCRNKGLIEQATTRTCHQQKNFRLGLIRSQFITLQRIGNGLARTIDKVKVPSPKKYIELAYVRKTTRLLPMCGDECWTFTTPAAATTELEDTHIIEVAKEEGMAVNLESLPPSYEW